MTYTLPWLIENFEKGNRKKYLFFWGHQKSRSGELTSSCFSQWWASPFVVDDVRFNTAEHWMMAQKALLFGDKEIYERIIAAKSPAEAKELGRQARRFDDAIVECPEIRNRCKGKHTKICPTRRPETVFA